MRETHSKDYTPLEADCDKALKQIVEKDYAKELENDSPIVLSDGIAFYKKACLIKKLDESRSVLA